MWGCKCPKCGKNPTDLLGTTNEYQNHCTDCDIRFTNEGEIYGESIQKGSDD